MSISDFWRELKALKIAPGGEQGEEEPNPSGMQLDKHPQIGSEWRHNDERNKKNEVTTLPEGKINLLD